MPVVIPTSQICRHRFVESLFQSQSTFALNRYGPAIRSVITVLCQRCAVVHVQNLKEGLDLARASEEIAQLGGAGKKLWQTRLRHRRGAEASSPPQALHRRFTNISCSDFLYRLRRGQKRTPTALTEPPFPCPSQCASILPYLLAEPRARSVCESMSSNLLWTSELSSSHYHSLSVSLPLRNQPPTSDR